MSTTKQSTVTISEAAELLSCHPQTIRRLIAAGRIPATRLGGGPGGHFRIPTAELTDFIRGAQEHTHTHHEGDPR